jgi:hypothetical protein
MYETIMDMEETDMEEYVQQYMNQSEEGQIINDEMTNALSLAWTLLSRTPCIRCHQGAIVFEPVLPGSLAEGARALCSGAPGTGAGEGRGGCRFRLERDALLYLANAANTHRYVSNALIATNATGDAKKTTTIAEPSVKYSVEVYTERI